MGDDSTTDPTPKPLARARWKLLIAGFALSFLIVGLAEAGQVLFGRNFHVVIPDQIYRCSQPPASELDNLIESKGIKTVVNLRGCCAPFPWYLEECRVTQRRGVSQEDICLSAGRMPPKQEVGRLIEVLDRSPYPLLFHCYHGADRTGLASAVALLVKTDLPLGKARAQLGLRYGHVSIGRTGNLDRFFDLYSQWLARRGQEHTPGLFRQWAATDYTAGECRARLEWLDPPSQPLRVTVGKPFAVRVRCTNASSGMWRLHRGSNVGIHGCAVVNQEGGQPVAMTKAGLFDREVAPGQAVDLTFAFEPIWKTGVYRLFVDMIDERQGFFYQEGSEPLERELAVCGENDL